MPADNQRLLVLRLNDSFAALWPTLARECGLDLELCDAAERLVGATDTVGIVSAGGDEERLERIFREIGPTDTPVAAVGAQSDRRTVVATMRAGAADFFALTDDLDLLRSWVREQSQRLRTRRTRDEFVENQRGKYRFDGILGESPALVAALDCAARIIPHRNITVLITGETGTGKELFARALHYNGPRREAPFIDVNCAAIPEHLLESELYGHEKGAFTDATSAKPGLFEIANGGTIFLDEIGHLPAILQGKLLRVLQERHIRRVGGTASLPIDVKVVAATHVNLADAVHRGEFREDLYYRLNVVPIELPPLRARPEDIVPLARQFLRSFAREYGIATPHLLGEAERVLQQRRWPGNVRELRNAMERAVLLAEGSLLTAHDVEEPTTPSLPGVKRSVFPGSLNAMIQATVREMVESCGTNKSEAARRLGISRARLQRLLQLDERALDDDRDEPPVASVTRRGIGAWHVPTDRAAVGAVRRQ
jgi:DNA-binding NtrC family response regulator